MIIRSAASHRLMALSLFVLSACSNRPAHEAAPRSLSEAFPSVASQILGGPGFNAPIIADPVKAAEASLARRATVQLKLPAQGSEPFEVTLPGGLLLTVRERGLTGGAQLEGGATAYRGARRTSYFTATSTGFEEWLEVDEATDAPVAEWDVEGATLQLDGEAVALLDAAGVTRGRITAPWAVDARGTRARAWLEVAGQRLTLKTAARGHVLVDPAWMPATAMEPRFQHTATLLLNGKVLVVGGRTVTGAGPLQTTVQLFDPARGSWAVTGSMSTARYNHTATRLKSGKVLVAGGDSSSTVTTTVQASAEMYDPATGTWSPTQNPMTTSRYQHTATLLPNGQVLLVGGADNTAPLASVDLFTEGTTAATSSFTSTTALTTARSWHTATLLSDGQVVVIGGSGVAKAETWDPATTSWTESSPINVQRNTHMAIGLSSGKVLVAGGRNSNALTSTELYDPATGTFTVGPPMPEARASGSATLLPNDTVLVVGGSGLCAGPCAYPTTTTVYDPSNTAIGAWSSGVTSVARAYHTATLLPTGRVFVVGGANGGGLNSSAEAYDPLTDSWLPSQPTLKALRAAHTATLLPSGQVLLTGGMGNTAPQSSAELYAPDGGTWTLTGPMAVERTEHTATLLNSGRVLVSGGRTVSSGFTATAEVFNPATGTWQTTGPMGSARAQHASSLLPDGRVLATGGLSATSTAASPSSEIYDPSTGQWTTTSGAMGAQRSSHTLTSLLSGKVLATGGQTPAAAALGTAEVFDPTTGTWTATTTAMTGPRFAHTATLLPSGQVLVVGGLATTTGLATAETYDPTVGLNGSWNIAPSPSVGRYGHGATLLLNGTVLIAGGRSTTSGALRPIAEVFDPAGSTTGAWSTRANLTIYRLNHTATLLSNGNVLLTGGLGSPLTALGDVSVYSNPATVLATRPTLSTVPGLSAPAAALTLGGSLFTGVSEAAGGNGASSPSNFPLVQLDALGSGQRRTFPVSLWSPTTLTSNAGPPAGLYWVRVVSNGAPSDPSVVPVFPSLAFTPTTPTVAPRGTRTFVGTGSAGSGYGWSLTQANSLGSINPSTGVYVAGATGSTTDIVQVRDPFGNTATTNITVSAGVTIAPGTVSAAPRGSATLSATGGSNAGFTWTLSTNASSGSIGSSTGMYLAGDAGTVTDVVSVVDSLGNTATRNITVSAGMSISPATAALPPRGSQTFTGTGGSGTGFAWALITNNSGATFNPGTAAYTAGFTTPGVSDVVRVTDSLGNSATVTIAVGPALAPNPSSPSVAPRQQVAFSVTNGQGPYAWTFVTNNSSGTLSGAGAYQAGSTASVTDTVRVTDGLGNTATVAITVGPAVSLTPPSAASAPRGSVTFAAAGGSNAGFVWAMASNPSGGAVTGAGVYTAGSTPNVTDAVRVTDSLGNQSTANVTVGGGVAISPSTATVAPRASRTFTASGGSNAGFVWALATNNSLTATIDPTTGVYTAGNTGPVIDVVRATDSLGNIQTVNVNVSAGVGISPQSASIAPLGTVSFSAMGGNGGPYTWSLLANNSGGATINSGTGSYTAGATQATDTVRAIDALGNVATVDVTVTNALRVTPNLVTLAPKQSQGFTASGGSGSGNTWVLLVNNSGASFAAGTAAYVAGAMGNVVDRVRVTDSLGATAEGVITITAGVSIAPASAAVTPRGSRTFIASGGSGSGFGWTFAANLSGGTLDPATGDYVAGTTGGVVDVVQATDSLGNLATANVTVGAAVSVTPATASVPPQGTQTFGATGGSGTGFTWSLLARPSGTSATIDPFTGQYQAGTRGDVTDVVQARDSLGNLATVSIAVTSGVSIAPAAPTVTPRSSLPLVASGGSGTGFTWEMRTNLSQGTLSAAGLYTAGATGNVTDVVAVTDSLGNAGTVSITVSGSLALTPALSNLAPRAALTFTVVGGVAPYGWALTTNGSGGSIDGAGAYLAGSTPDVSDVVTVTDSLGNASTATINVTAGVSVTPSTTTLAPGGRQVFTAMGGSGTGFTWALKTDASGASIDADGVYLAGARGAVSDVVEVTDSLGNAGAATISVVAGASNGTEVPFSERAPVSGFSCGCQSTDPGIASLFGLLALVLFSRRRRGLVTAAALVLTCAALPTLAAAPKKASRKATPVPPTPVEPPAPQPVPAAEPAQPAVVKPPSTEKPSVVVLNADVTVPNEKLDANAFSDLLVSALDGTGLFRVTSAKDLATILGLERQKQLMGCSDDSNCMAELANALGADLVLAASVGRLADTYLVTVRLIDGKRSRVVARGTVQSKDPNQLLNAMWTATQQTLDAYGATLPPPAAEAWAQRPKQTPPAALVAAPNGPVSSFGVSAGMVAGYQVLSNPGLRGSIGAEVDVTWRLGRLDVTAGVLIGPNIGARLGVSWALLASRFRLQLGLRGATYPGLTLFGGGPAVTAEFALNSLFAVTGTGGGEIYPAPGAPIVVLLGSLGAAAHF